MNESMIELDDSDLSLDLTHMTIRSRWLTDQRIIGTPLSIYLYLRQVTIEVRHQKRMEAPTQTQAMAELGIGGTAWVTAKKKLLRAGFLIEIRDRYPEGFVHLRRGSNGRILERVPRGGQKRYRIRLKDPGPGLECALSDAVFDLDEPYEEWLERQIVVGSTFCRSEAEPATTKRRGGEDPQISPVPQNVDASSPALQNVEPFKGTQDWIGQEGLDGITPLQSSPHGSTRANDATGSSLNPPVTSLSVAASRQGSAATAAAHLAEPIHTAPAQSASNLVDTAAVDTQLRAIHPSLSVRAFVEELSGRVDVDQLDLVRASTEILGRARGTIGYAPSYVAVGILKAPSRFLQQHTPFQGKRSAAADASSAQESAAAARRAGIASCERGDHFWGSESWPLASQAHCTRDTCTVSRASVDPEYAAFLDGGSAPVAHEFGGASWGA